MVTKLEVLVPVHIIIKNVINLQVETRFPPCVTVWGIFISCVTVWGIFICKAMVG